MKNIILFLVLITALCEAQQFRPANLEIPIVATDGVFTRTLTIGIDTTATDGIDLHLGEEPIFILPPSGTFETRFFLLGDTTSYKDFRNANSFPFTGIREHRFKWQLSSIATLQFTVMYNFPADVSANIKDIFGGIFFNQNLNDSGSFTITSPINEAFLTMFYNNIVIPVELTSLTASLSGSSIKLDWVSIIRNKQLRV